MYFGKRVIVTSEKATARVLYSFKSKRSGPSKIYPATQGFYGLGCQVSIAGSTEDKLCGAVIKPRLDVLQVVKTSIAVCCIPVES